MRLKKIRQFLCGLFFHGWIEQVKTVITPTSIQWVPTGVTYCMFCGKVKGS